MKKLTGLNEKMVVLVKGDGPIPTFKEIIIKLISVHRPKDNEEVKPEERVKISRLGLCFLATKNEMEIDDGGLATLKMIVDSSRGYPEFIMGQLTDKIITAANEGSIGRG